MRVSSPWVRCGRVLSAIPLLSVFPSGELLVPFGSRPKVLRSGSCPRLGIHLAGILDTQLAYEHVTGDPHNTVADVLARWGPPVDEARGPVVRWTRPPGAVTQPRLQRSLEADLLSVARLAACRPAVVAELGPDLDAPQGPTERHFVCTPCKRNDPPT